MELEIIKNKNNQRGFTLVELLVSLAVFSLLIFALATITGSIIKAQRKAFAIQSVQEPARYILEVISKEIRVSGINSNTGDNMPSLNITNPQNEVIDYQFANNKIQRRVDGGIWEDLSSSNLEITGSFYIVNEPFPKRAKVTIVMETKITGGRAESGAGINTQNTITPRSF